jgi:cell division protease FtsH
VVAAALGQTMALDKLSIIARGRGVGHLALATEESMLPTSDDIETRIAIAMAGVAAEELVLGQISVGSESDLERATNAARDMAGRFGMSDRLGRVRVLRQEREIFLGRDYLLTGDVSQPTLEHLDGEVRRILDEQESRARSILVANRAILDDLAVDLAAAETLHGPQLQAHLEHVRLGLATPGRTAAQTTVARGSPAPGSTAIDGKRE